MQQNNLCPPIPLVEILLWIFHLNYVNLPFFKFENNFKMLNFLLHIFEVYVFCLGVYMFYRFFSNKLVVWIYNFIDVMVYFKYCKIIFVCKLLKLMSNYRLRCVVMK